MRKKNIVQTAKNNIIRIRTARGLSQTDLAKKMGTSQRLVAYYENKAPSIPLEKLQEFADTLEVTVTELLDETNKKGAEIPDIDIRLVKKFKQIEELPRRAKDALWHTINTTIEMNELKTAKRKIVAKKD